ncbi:MAG: DUF11 domain-containing protein, partial [Nitriliruptorales bacterium]|nr:DUF11 domain-containing protein [Nitriliruptorales bacterium]
MTLLQHRRRSIHLLVSLAMLVASAASLAAKPPDGGGGKKGGGDSVNWAIEAFDTVSVSYTRGNTIRFAEGDQAAMRVLADAAPGTFIDEVETTFDHSDGTARMFEDLRGAIEYSIVGGEITNQSNPTQHPFLICEGNRTAAPVGAAGCTPIPVVDAVTNQDPGLATPYVYGPEFRTIGGGVTQGFYTWHNLTLPASGKLTLAYSALLALPDENRPDSGGASDWSGSSGHMNIGDAIVNGADVSVGNKDVPFPVNQIITSDIDKQIDGLDVIMPEDLAVGETATVTLIATTSGPKRTTMDLTIQDVLPSCLSYQNSATVNGTPKEPTINGSTLEWFVPDVKLGSSVKVEFLVKAETEGQCENLGVLIPEFGQPSEDDVPIDIRGIADLTIAKDCGDPQASPGDTITHTITFGNIGTGVALNVEIKDVLEDGLTYVTGSAELNGNGISDPSGSGTNADPYVFDIGTLSAGEASDEHTLTYDVKIADEGSLDNQDLTDGVTISTTSNEEVTDNNSASCEVKVPFAPNLDPSKTCPGTVEVGEQAEHKITVTNIGTAPAGSTTVTDVLPAGMNYVDGSASLTPDSVTPNPDDTTTIVWTLASVSTSSPAMITYKVTIDAAGQYTNTVSVSTAGDSNTSNDTADCTTGALAADVFVTKTCPGVAAPGATVTHTLTYGNEGNTTAEGVKIDDVLEGGQTYVANSATGDFASVSQSGNTLTFTIGDLGTVGDVGTKQISYQVSIPGTQPTAGQVTFKDTATISTTTAETDTADNSSDPCETVVTYAPVLTLGKSDCPEVVAPGGILLYNLTWSVGGSAPADDLVLVDTLPAGVSILDADGGTVSGNTITWDLGDQPIGASGSEEIRVLVTAGDGTTLVNTATLDTTSIEGSPDKTATTSTDVSLAGANTTGAAYALDVDLLGASLINELAGVSTSAPSGTPVAGDVILPIGIPGVLDATIVSTGSFSNVGSGMAVSTSTSEVLDLDLLSGAITADVVRAVSQSSANPFNAGFGSAGATFVDLRINGMQITNVQPNTTVDVKNPLLPSQTIARAVLLEETGTSNAAGPGG